MSNIIILLSFFSFFLHKDMGITKAQMDKKDKQAAPVESEGRSTGVVELIAKRKRRPPGEWWIYSGQGSEETKDTEEQPQSKKSKQNNRKPPAAAPSPVQTKKQRVLKKMNQAEPIASSSQSTNNNKSKKEKKVKRTKQPNDRNNRRDNVKASKALDAVEEQIELQEQQQFMDKDLDPLQSSPLLLTHRDQSLDSGKVMMKEVIRSFNFGKHTEYLEHKYSLPEALLTCRGCYTKQNNTTEKGNLYCFGHYEPR